MTFPEFIPDLKPRLRGWLHVGMVPTALAAGIVLIALAETTPARVSAAIYAGTALLLFAVSGIYHRGSWSPKVESFLRRFDHANIYLLIAGSYTPFGVLTLDGHVRVAALATVWGGALAGVIFRTTWLSAPRWLFTAFYLLLGWAAVIFLPQLLHGAGVAAFVLVAVGGGLYTAGGIVYGLKRPNPSPAYFGFHEVFHSLTIAAFITQYIAVSLVIYRI
ncbi:MAG: hemolysin [Frankiales bacterium]|nr:hemolysin [Frankiales bacterium]